MVLDRNSERTAGTLVHCAQNDTVSYLGQTQYLSVFWRSALWFEDIFTCST